MSSPESPSSSPPPSGPVPRPALQMMIVILAALAFMSLFANIQNWRRDKLETVTVIPQARATPTPSATAAP